MPREREPSSSATVTSHTSMNFSGERAFISSAFQRHQHARSHCLGSNPKEQLESALGPVFQSMHLAVPELQYAGIPRLSGALKTPVRAGEQDETDHKIPVHLHVEKSLKFFQKQHAWTDASTEVSSAARYEGLVEMISSGTFFLKSPPSMFTLSEFQPKVTSVALKVRPDQLMVGFPALKTPPRAVTSRHQRAGRESSSRSESTFKKKMCGKGFRGCLER